MVRKIYIVLGSSGKYDDHCSWVVCSFVSKEKAEEWAELCDLKATEAIKFLSGNNTWWFKLTYLDVLENNGVHNLSELKNLTPSELEKINAAVKDVRLKFNPYDVNMNIVDGDAADYWVEETDLCEEI